MLLKLNIQKTKIMASGPITSWEIDGETVETESEFILGGSKITADGDCSHEIKRCLLLGRKVITNLDSIFKSRDITLSTKVRLVKAMVFPVVMDGCESWTIKKTELQRIELWVMVLEKTLKTSPTPQLKSISSSALSFLSGPILTSIHDYWKNHSFDYTDLCWQSNVSAF